MAYHCINGLPLPLIYGLTRITIVEVIMLFWQVCKVAILKNLSWFLICLGWKSQYSFICIVKEFTLQAIVGSRNVQITYGKMFDLHDVFLGSHTIGIIFLFRSQDHDRKPKSWNVKCEIQKCEKMIIRKY